MFICGRFLPDLIFVLILFVNTKDSFTSDTECDKPHSKFGPVDILENQNNCYYVFDTYVARDKTKEICCGFDAHLLWIESSEENTFISDTLKDLGKKDVWIGSRKLSNETTWESCSNTTKPVVYENWYQRKPEIRKAFSRLNIQRKLWSTECRFHYELPVVCEKCKLGFFGDNCESQCDNCTDLLCDPIDGICQNITSLPEENIIPISENGTSPEKNCSKGYYGTDCLLKCGHCKHYAPCHQVSGICPEGCQEGWYEDTCDIQRNKTCSANGEEYKYGEHFKIECNYCVCASDGMPACTLKSCPPQNCSKGYYGTDCLLKCGHCKHYAPCHRVSGICPEGCQEGWYEDTCDIQRNKTCSANGKEYKYGEHFKIECNYCVCASDGVPACTLKSCPPQRKITCSANGKRYNIGDHFKVECNFCICNIDGKTACTLKSCASQTTDCPTHGEDLFAKRSNTCYYSFNTKKDFAEANKKCHTFNGHILWLESKKEEEFISNEVLKYSVFKHSWLGATRQINGVYQWTTHTKVFGNMATCKWLTGHPRTNATHVIIWKIENDIFCLSITDQVPRPYICETCIKGYYGTDCISKCGHCKYYATCDSASGFCTYGCQKGWSGPRCDIQICPNQFYGKDCDQHCGKCKGGVTCNYKTGICENSCQDQWIGEKCQEKLISEGESIKDGNIVYTVHGMRAKSRENFLFAQNRCCKKNSHILWLETEKEDLFVSKHILQRMLLSASWLGAGRYNCDYKWISCNDHKAMTYKNWYVSRSAANAPHIAVKMLKSQKATWIKIYNGLKLPYICERCVDGFYGEDCKLKCNHCWKSLCDVITGHCLHGCIDGYYGKKCDVDGSQGLRFSNGRTLYLAFGRYNRERNYYEAQLDCCSLGFHLLWLESKAEEEFIKNKILNVIDEDLTWLGVLNHKNKYGWVSCINVTAAAISPKGNAEKDCFKGRHMYLDKHHESWQNVYGSEFYMPFICEGCQHGFYGLNCSLHCGNCARNTPCDAVSGLCFHGCARGWHGLMCKTPNNYIKGVIQVPDTGSQQKVDQDIEDTFYLPNNPPRSYPVVIYEKMDEYLGHLIDQKSSLYSPSNFSVAKYREMAQYLEDIFRLLRSDHGEDSIGCFADKTIRAMNDLFNSSDSMTIKLCKEYCHGNGYIYAALQYGKQCFCGNGAYDKYGESKGCNTPCSGSRRDICGGFWANSVFKVGEVPDNENGQLLEMQMDNPDDSIGCFADEPIRAMNGLFYSSDSMTIKLCNEYCHGNGYMYAAIQYGKQCFCGNGAYDKYGESNDCNTPCSGNDQEICGGTWASNVFKVGDFIGCYVDTPSRAMADILLSFKSMTVEWCKHTCHHNGYMYAALQNGQQCFCGHGGYDKYGESKNCNMGCTGNQKDICGGSWANSVYEVGDTIGCFIDKSIRAMNDLSNTFESLTVELCKGYCHDNGYIYAALQYGKQCFCGNGGYDKYGKSEKCNMLCPGNNQEVCGGSWVSSVYRVGDSIGCFADKSIRAMNGLSTTFEFMTFELCKEYCRGNGFIYAAIQYGKQCFCGNYGYDKYGKSKDCNMPCPGNDREFCGGSWASTVFKVGDSIGCFVDTRVRALNYKFETSELMTVKLCKGHCRVKGFMYAALQYGKQCFCGNGAYDKFGKSSDCNMHCKGNDKEFCGGFWASTVYKVGDFIGCYADTPNRAMADIFVSSKSMTVGLCKKICQKKGYKFAALQNGEQCFCGNDGYKRYGTSENCNMDCIGNHQDICGGSWANSVYAVGEIRPGDIKDIDNENKKKPPHTDSIGCYADTPSRAMNDLSDSSKSMTVEWCKHICHHNGYTFAALQNGDQCFCGNDGYKRYGTSANCNMPCSGNNQQICGGSWANSVYRVADYIGCYVDKDSRAMVALFSSPHSMDIEWCKLTCHRNLFTYAALQHGKECRCGHYDYDKYGKSENCNTPCTGKNQQICGGYWANSVYKSGDFLGCYEDKPSRALNGLSDSSKSMTTGLCKTYCHKNGYKYAALQNEEQCFCGNDGYNKYGKAEKCNMRCAGNNQEICGGSWANSVYIVEDKPPERISYFPTPSPDSRFQFADWMGCFADKEIRAMNDTFFTYKSMTVQLCREYCYVNGYIYAALQNGEQCFCGNDGYNKYGTSGDCKKACLGNDKEICGGSWASTVYKVGDFMGCYLDKSDRALRDISVSFKSMTVDWCKRICQDNGYMYAGLQNGDQCFCGNDGYKRYGKAKNCNKDCTGNNQEICGGYWSNLVYKITDSIGCFADKEIRAMNDLSTTSEVMTVELCKTSCRQNGYMYAALQHGEQCFCGNDGYDKYGKSSDCDMRCQGDDKEICGGTWASTVYKVGDSIGCFADLKIRAMNDLSDSSESMTTGLCKASCHDNGYKYAASQYGKQCFCGNGAYDKYGKSSDCNTRCQGNDKEFCGGSWASTVYKVGDSIGCFADSLNRAMDDLSTTSKKMTVKLCKAYCRANKYMYAALQNGEKCFCGNGGYDRYGKSRDCNTRCKGNDKEFCGGSWTNTVYKVGDFIGCYLDKSNRALNDIFVSFKSMTVEWCKQICLKNGYKFAALQNGEQCSCGNYGYDKYGTSANCDTDCAGNHQDTCGGYWANSVYKVGKLHDGNNDLSDPYLESDYIPDHIRRESVPFKDFVGCFLDTSIRAMNDLLTISPAMTIGFCQSLCRHNGNMYAALQNGEQCFCGNDGYAKYREATNCNMTCSGNNLEICGGSWANSVYRVGDKPDDRIDYLPGHVGCFGDHKDWAMRMVGTYNGLTIPFCTNECQEQGYKYAGLQNGNECFCGDDSFKTLSSEPTKCGKRCEGNKQTLCGGLQAKSLYKVRGYVGCYVNDVKRTLTKEIEGIINMTICKCKTECRKRGYTYSGLQSGSQCFCGDKDYDKYGTSTECKEYCDGDEQEICGGTLANSVFKVGDYMGCFELNENQTFLARIESKNMTIPICKEFCRKKGTEYAGLHNSGHCICENQFADSRVKSSNCDKRCTGDDLTRCGGLNAISFYKVGEYIGCFEDQKDRSLNFEVINNELTVNICQQLCFAKGLKYAGIQYKRECFCGDDGYDKYGTSEKCTERCPGNPTKECGGFWAMSVYVAKGDSPP